MYGTVAPGLTRAMLLVRKEVQEPQAFREPQVKEQLVPQVVKEPQV